MKIYFFFLVFTAVMSLSVKAQFSGNALHFDGLNDYVDMGNAATFDIATAVTYEAWINPDTSHTGFIFNKWVAFAEDKQLRVSGDRIEFYIHNIFNGNYLVSSSTISNNQFTHIAATYDASMGTAMIYINGVLDATESVNSNVGNSSGGLYYGHNPARNDNICPFKGIIDEVRIWNIARTESEIQSTMNQSLNGNETGLIGYWKFDEGTGTITSDETSNHNYGTISGAAWVPGPTPVENENNFTQPDQFSLQQNYPNPFNPSTKIKYTIPSVITSETKQSQMVSLKVYDVLGSEAATLVETEQPAGIYEVNFDASQLASGMYLYRLQAGSFIETKKMILIR